MEKYSLKRLSPKIQNNKDFVAFDTETTGLSPITDRIIEISAIKYRNGIIVDELSVLIDSVDFIPIAASRVNKICISDLKKDGLSEEEAYEKLINFLGEEVLYGKIPLVAHNARFDMEFLTNTLLRLNLLNNYTFVCIDTLKLAMNTYPYLYNYKLETIAKHLNIKFEKLHRATEDARICGELLLSIINERKGV